MRAHKKSRFAKLRILGYIDEHCTPEEYVQRRLNGDLREEPRPTVGMVKEAEALNKKLKEEGYQLCGLAERDHIGKKVQEIFDARNTRHSREIRIIRASEIDPECYSLTETYHVYSRPSFP